MAVKVIVDPAQTVDGTAVMVTLTARLGLTVMVIELEVAGLLEMQIVFEEVIVQLTTSAVAGI